MKVGPTQAADPVVSLGQGMTAAEGSIPPPSAPPQAGFTCQVYPCDQFRVTSGANLGDAVGPVDLLCQGDVYQLVKGAAALSLRLDQPADRRRKKVTSAVVAAGSDIGTAADRIRIAARLMLMAPDGDKVDMLVLALADTHFAMPLMPMTARTDYTLIRCEADPGDVQLTDIACVSFSRGTMIALADGRQMPIEALAVGDKILTRDHGPQPLRWIGRATLRAIGSFAPVVISKGTLGNDADLIVSQHHRVFMYHRNRPTGLRTAELLVQAKDLVDGEGVFLREGGFVDYFSLVFDRHEIIYAEGIPAESLMVSDATLARLPEGLAAEVEARFPGLSQAQHYGTEADAALLTELGPQGLLRKGTDWPKPPR